MIGAKHPDDLSSNPSVEIVICKKYGQQIWEFNRRSWEECKQETIQKSNDKPFLVKLQWLTWKKKIIFRFMYVSPLAWPAMHLALFYLSHMKYGKVLVSRRENQKFFFAYFHVLWLFIPKKHDLSEKKISVCHAPLPLYAKFVPRLQPRP